MHEGEFNGQTLSTLLISPSAYKESSSSFAMALAEGDKLIAPAKRRRACLLDKSQVKSPSLSILDPAAHLSHSTIRMK